MEFRLEQIPDVAANIIARAQEIASPDHATLVTFSGDLGAGKTTMIQEIARQLGVDGELVSPTFVIYKRYEVGSENRPWNHLIHGDMYRLEHADDIKKLGWDALLADPKNFLCIEWPEKITDAIPDWTIQVELGHGGDSEVRSFRMK